MSTKDSVLQVTELTDPEAPIRAGTHRRAGVCMFHELRIRYLYPVNPTDSVLVQLLHQLDLPERTGFLSTPPDVDAQISIPPGNLSPTSIEIETWLGPALLRIRRAEEGHIQVSARSLIDFAHESMITLLDGAKPKLEQLPFNWRPHTAEMLKGYTRVLSRSLRLRFNSDTSEAVGATPNVFTIPIAIWAKAGAPLILQLRNWYADLLREHDYEEQIVTVAGILTDGSLARISMNIETLSASDAHPSPALEIALYELEFPDNRLLIELDMSPDLPISEIVVGVDPPLDTESWRKKRRPASRRDD